MAAKSISNKRFFNLIDDIYIVNVKVKTLFNSEFFNKLLYGNSRKIKKGMAVILERYSDSQIAVWDVEQEDVLFSILEDKVLNEVISKSNDVIVGRIREVNGPNDDFYDVELSVKAKKVPKKYIISTIDFKVEGSAMSEVNLDFTSFIAEQITQTKTPCPVQISLLITENFFVIHPEINDELSFMSEDENLYAYLKTHKAKEILIKNIDIIEDEIIPKIELAITVNI